MVSSHGSGGGGSLFGGGAALGTKTAGRSGTRQASKEPRAKVSKPKDRQRRTVKKDRHEGKTVRVKIIRIDEETIGDAVDGDHSAGASVIQVNDAADFSVGAKVTFDDGANVYTVTAYDCVAETVTISPPLSVPVEDGSEAGIWDEKRKKVTTIKTARVSGTNDEVDGDAGYAEVAASISGALPTGDDAAGTNATMQMRAGRWTVVDAPGREGSASAGYSKITFFAQTTTTEPSAKSRVTIADGTEIVQLHATAEVGAATITLSRNGEPIATVATGAVFTKCFEPIEPGDLLTVTSDTADVSGVHVQAITR